MFARFDEEAQKVLLMAKKEMADLRHPYVGTEHLLLAILHNKYLNITKVLSDYGITYEVYLKEIIKVIGTGKESNNWFLFTPLLKRVIENATIDSREEKGLVSVERLFLALLAEGEGVANRVLMGMNIDIDALYDKFDNDLICSKKSNSSLKELDEYAVNLNDLYLNEGFDPVIGRDDVVERVLEILLRRSKNNPLLIGEAGVGKTAIVEEVVRRIVRGDVPKKLENVVVYSLSLSALVAGTRYRGEFEERINKIIKEVENNDNVVLFIDEIHTLVGAGGAEGAIDASNILKPYLARGKVRIIGATTKKEYSKFFEGDKAFDRRFQKIIVEEATLDKVLDIIFNVRSVYEEYHNIKISDDVIKLIVNLSDRYITNNHFPDKAIDVLDEACSKMMMTQSGRDKKISELTKKIKTMKQKKNDYIVLHQFDEASKCREEQYQLEDKLNKLVNDNRGYKKRILTSDIVYHVVAKKSMVPYEVIRKPDINKITKLITEKVRGQDENIKNIIKYMLHDSKKVCPSFLLIGKSGVGKTLFVEECARNLYGSESFIRLDMSEYRESHSISKIIGSPPGYVGYSDANNILDKIKINSYVLLLLDEVEKAHPEVLKLFLQVMDVGYMTNAVGEKISFKNVVLFMTSNIGCDIKSVGFKSNNNLADNNIRKYFGEEFVNRIDKVVYFNDLDSKAIRKIVEATLEKRGLSFSTKTVDKIISLSEYEKFGARKVEKIIDEEYSLNKVKQ